MDKKYILLLFWFFILCTLYNMIKYIKNMLKYKLFHTITIKVAKTFYLMCTILYIICASITFYYYKK